MKELIDNKCKQITHFIVFTIVLLETMCEYLIHDRNCNKNKRSIIYFFLNETDYGKKTEAHKQEPKGNDEDNPKNKS